MRKVFLDELPHKPYRNIMRIDWKNSIGHDLKFVYDDIKGSIKIINIGKHESITIKYLNSIYTISSQNLITCQLGVAIGVKSNKFRYSIGDVVKTNTGEIKITNQMYIYKNNDSKRRGYKYICLIDNYIGKILEKDLIKGEGCYLCSGKVVVEGYNDMWTTAPETAKLLLNPKYGYKYSKGSNSYLDWKCPNCGNIIKNKQIKSICCIGLSCPKCGDGISYPEKFTYNLLEQLNVDFEYQLAKTTFEWCKGKDYDVKYDFYIPLKNCIIETHGIQHYENQNKSSAWNKYTLQEEQDNDKFKKQLAKENGITDKNYIVIDCRHSTMKWIRDDILKSELANLFDLSKIDWLKVDSQSHKSIVKEVCDAWKIGIKNTNILHIMFKLDISCIRNYLHKGTKLGWCDYNPKHSKEYSYKYQ